MRFLHVHLTSCMWFWFIEFVAQAVITIGENLCINSMFGILLWVDNEVSACPKNQVQMQLALLNAQDLLGICRSSRFILHLSIETTYCA